MKPALFLDRDGTIIVDQGYLSDPDGVRLLPGVVEGLRRFQDAGFLLVVVTNQSGIGRGYFTEAQMHAVNRRVLDLLEAEGIRIDAVYFSPDLPGHDSPSRKPRPDMLLQAAREHGIDMGRSVMVGDKLSDMQAGQAAGCRWNLRLPSQNGAPYDVKDLIEAADRVLGVE